MAERPRSPSPNSCLATSLSHFAVRPVTWRLGEARVAGDDRRIERLCQGDVHGVVHRDVLAQLPRASQEIEMGVMVEIEVGKIRNRLGRSRSGDTSPAVRGVKARAVSRT